jgi:hypothetical protein
MSTLIVVWGQMLDIFRFPHLSVREFLKKRPEYISLSVGVERMRERSMGKFVDWMNYGRAIGAGEKGEAKMVCVRGNNLLNYSMELQKKEPFIGIQITLIHP